MPRGLELLIAQTILQGFDAQYGRFLEVTSGAQQRFEQADWHAVQQAMKNRIHLYDHHVGLVVEQLRCITNGQSTDAAFLLRVKEHYTRLKALALRITLDTLRRKIIWKLYSKKHLPIPYAKSLPAPIRINIFHMPVTDTVL